REFDLGGVREAGVEAVVGALPEAHGELGVTGPLVGLEFSEDSAVVDDAYGLGEGAGDVAGGAVPAGAASAGGVVDGVRLDFGPAVGGGVDEVRPERDGGGAV